MGQYWLHDIPAKLQAAGVNLQLWPGWELRSRSSGGYDNIMGIGIHHDAGPPNLSLASRCSYAWNNAQYRPIGAMWIHTDGTVVFGAAGATNTMGTQVSGRDSATRTSKGVVPFAKGNQNLIAIEMSNDGMGQVWPKAQCDALVKVLAALCTEFDFNPLTDIVSHHRYTSRKVDPRGVATGYPGWGGYTGLNEWNDVNVGKSVANSLLPEHEEEMTQLIDQRLFDSRVVSPTSGSKVVNNQVLSYTVGVPAEARLAKIRFTTLGAEGNGFVRAWGKGGEPTKVAHNYYPAPGAIAQDFKIELRDDNTFTVKFYGSPTHVIIDAVEWSN